MRDFLNKLGQFCVLFIFHFVDVGQPAEEGRISQWVKNVKDYSSEYKNAGYFL